MKRILFFLSALLLTSVGYAQPMDKQMKKATKSATVATRGQILKEKVAITSAFQAKEKAQKQFSENALLLKPYNKMHSLFDKFLASPAARSLNLGKIQNTGKRNMPGMFRYNETVQSVPYSITFDSQDAFNEFMVIDNNDDGYSWEWQGSYVRYIYSGTNVADDYFIAPPISMEAGKNYSITVNVQAASTSYPERFEILVGTEATVAGLTTTALSPVEVTSSTAADYEGSFTPEASGTFYVAIHCISAANQWYLRLNSFSVTVGASTDAPAAPTVTATPGENGELSATVVVNAPKNAINGEKLQSNLTKVELYRDGQNVYEEEDVAPGATLTFTEGDLTNGTHKYYAIAYNAEGPGQKSEEVSIFVGEDTPAAVANFVATDNYTSVLFDWDPVETGENGGYINPANITYDIYELIYDEENETYALSDEPIATTQENTYELTYNTEEGDQDYAYWYIYPKNDTSVGSASYTSLLVGAPYELPLVEGFADKTLHYLWDTNGYLGISSNATDDDGVALRLTGEEEGYVYFLSGKLNLKDATAPALYMDVASSGVDGFYVIGWTESSDMMILDVIEPTSEYTTITVPLTALQNNEHYAQVGIYCYINNPTYIYWGDYLDIDNIRIQELPTNDLEINVTNPSIVKAGDSANITAIVQNKGANAVSGYTVTIKAGEEELLNETVNEELASFETKEFTAELETSIYDEASTLPIVAEVTYNADADTENNKAETQIKITVSNLLAPENLVAEVNEDNGVVLSWDAPSDSEVTEDFEDTSIFPAFELGGITEENHNGAFGEWKLYDGTGGARVYGFSDAVFDNESVPHAWQVIDNDVADLAAPPSGKQFLLSVCPVSSSGASADHWLISPELTGNAQTISFMLRTITASYGAETFEVLASSTDTDPASFVKVQDFETDVTDWTEFTANLPAGTKYFAIRHTSDDIFGLYLDDITFEKAASKPTAYNIYFEDNLVGTVEGDVTTFTIGADQTLTGEHNVGVTAVYDTQESAPAQATVNIGGAFQLGDVNHDGQVNITDVALTVAYVLTKATDNFFISEANMNGDDDVNITDVTALVALVLTNQAAND